MNLKIANDIGNSETKMIIDYALIKQPSVVKRLFSKPNVMETNIEKNITNLMDELVVNVSSKGIKRDGLYFIGNRANMTADQVENMNIKLGNKSKHDIPLLMSFSMTAAYAVQAAYQEDKKLPSSISIKVLMSSAIPASEYTPEKANLLQERFLKDTHVVVVYVGEESVTVKLTYERVKVTQEGVPALYSFLEGSKDMLKQYNEQYSETAETMDFRNKKLLHVDIGDGTTEYIYTVGMNPVNDACSGERRGVGHATEEAKKLLTDELSGHLTVNRQQFINILRDKTHNHHDLAVQFMDEARYLQAQRILEDVQEKYMTNTAGNVDAILVYGGGSIQFKSELYEELLDFANEVHCKLIWVPEEYAVNMNVKGMQILNEKVLFKTENTGKKSK